MTRRCLRGGASLLALGVACLLLAWAAPVRARALYKCVAADGVIAIVSNPHGYAHCEKVGEWGDAKPRALPSPPAHAPAPSAPRAIAMPGKPPEVVKDNPSVLKVTPLGDDTPPKVQALGPSVAWQPVPVALLDALAGSVLPRALGMAPAQPPRPVPAPVPAAAAATSAAIPLTLNTDVAKPPRTGAVYKVRQKNGTVLYTNVAALAQGGNAQKLFTYIIECYACNLHSHIDWATVPLQLAAFHDDVQGASRLTGVDAALLRAIIHAESNFNPRALSYKGAQGLMQLMPGTAFELGVGDAFDPAENISGGARYLAMLLRDFHGDVRLAAAAYNAGEGAVQKYGGVPPYAETQVYVKRVALLFQRYRKALAERDAKAGGSKLAAAGLR